MRILKGLCAVAVLTSVLTVQYTSAQSGKIKRINRQVERRLEKWKSDYRSTFEEKALKIDSFKVFTKDNIIEVYFPISLSYLPIREDESQRLYQSIGNKLGKKFSTYTISLRSNRFEIRDLVPNWDRKITPLDERRKDVLSINRTPLVRKSDGVIPARGLYNNNIALWNSHGIFFETSLDRWEYQRPRLFGTVEDVHPTMYVLQYLVPMLENAGAGVFLPRERDTQTNEVIVDNDKPGLSQLILPVGLKYETVSKGLLPKDTIYYGENPFELGTSIKIDPTLNAGRSLTYIPSIPERGQYAVYISYLRNNSNSTQVEYVVHHLGGDTRFLVNQRMGGSTWIYLGTFDFELGKNPNGSVTINIKGNEDGTISTDAVRFGGGMGNVARRPLADGEIDFQWKLSGKPRYMEGARYYLQYSGMPDTLTYNISKGKNDYTDDYQSRGEWVNYLIGSSKPQYRSSFNLGLNIPIDLSLAFHTDAGVTPGDSVIGTLSIYSTSRNDGRFSNGQSKMTNRDLADLVHTQIVDDIHRQCNPKWTRRAMWDKEYSEAFRPGVPSMLLELLSHQNAADMQYSLDSRFRFVVSRAIYKGMLRYLAFQQNRPYVVQPLPVDHFAISSLGSKSIRLSWKPVLDSLEVTARPEKYKVYKRIGNGGFDNGVVVIDTFMQVNIENYDQMYSFKVTALNDGGESFPSEVLSVGIKNDNAPVVLVVNGFDRISGPAFFDNGKTAGIAWWNDQGVPYISDIGHVGNQYDFDRKSDWKDDDSPGWGASHGDMEGKVIPGNSFDFTRVHGDAILSAGYSFVSVSDEVFTQPQFNTFLFPMIDIILGEEKSTPSLLDKHKAEFQIYTPAFMSKVKGVTDQGKGIFMSGAYVGSDLLKTSDSTAIKFARDILHFEWRTDHAVADGDFYSTDAASKSFKGKYTFNTSYNPKLYTVEAPDAIEPEGNNALTIFRYRENNSSAAVSFSGKYRAVVCGFPFETIKSGQERRDLMLQVLNFLNNK